MENRNRFSGNRNAMSRGRFLKTAGVAGGTVAVAGLGLGGAAKAQMPPGNPDFYERPVSDWLPNNQYNFTWFAGKYAICMGLNPPRLPLPTYCPSGSILNPLTCMLAFPGSAWDSVLAAPYPDPIAITTGSITERKLPDGRAGITVRITVKGGPLSIYRLQEFMAFRKGLIPEPEPILGKGGDGTVNYTLLAKFVNPAPMMPIACIIDYSWGRVPGGKMEALSFNGTGTGIFTDHAADFKDWHFTPGTLGTVHLPGVLAIGTPAGPDNAGISIEESDVEIY